METKIITPTGEKEICVTLGRFRLTNAVRLTDVEPVGMAYIPAAEELALEAATDKEGHYYVIAFIEYDKDAECCDMRTVGPRFIQNIKTDEDWHNIKALIEMANAYMTAANQKEEDY